jgi:hypothetical protein
MTMNTTLSANAEWLKDQSATSLCKIIELVNNEGYPIDDVRDFVEVYGSKALLEGHYETWAEIDESFDQDAIEAFVEEFGIENIEHFEDAYSGVYESEEQFAEEYFTECMDVQIPEGIVVDWEQTWDYSLRPIYTYCDGFVFHNNPNF